MGNVTVTGDFSQSDIVASINPGSGYVFGDSTETGGAGNDSFVKSGGTIGLVKISTGLQDAVTFFDQAAGNGIKAKTFTNGVSPVSTFTYGTNTGFIPSVVFYGQDEVGVRVTDLTFVTET